MFGLLLQTIFYQIITVNQTTPCFLNQSAGIDIWINCGYDKDWLQAILLPWEWISGGYFSMVLVSVIIGMTYLKYNNAIYPIIIGFTFLPVAWFAFPSVFLAWAVVMTGVAIGILVWYAYIKQTKEYD